MSNNWQYGDMIKWYDQKQMKEFQKIRMHKNYDLKVVNWNLASHPQGHAHQTNIHENVEYSCLFSWKKFIVSDRNT